MITAGVKICYYRTLWCIKCVLEAFPFNWAAWKGKKTEWEILRAVIYIYIYSLFSKYSFSSTKKIGKFVGK
jgi:hypothetical protein